MPLPASIRLVISAAQRRLAIAALLRHAGIGIALGSLGSLAAVLLDRAAGTQLPPAWLIATPPAIGLLAAATLTWVRRASPLDAAVRLDHALRLRDRFGSALALSDDAAPADPAFRQLALRAAEESVRRVDPRLVAPLKPGRAWLLAPLGLLAAALTAWLTPPGPWIDRSLAQRLARERAAAPAAQQAAERVNEIRQSLIAETKGPAANSPASSEQLKALEELERDLRANRRDPAEIQREAAQVVEQIARSREAEQGERERQAAAVRDRLAQLRERDQQPRSDLGRYMQSGDPAAAAQALDQLINQLDRMSPEERARVADDLQQLAQQLDPARRPPAPSSSDASKPPASTQSLREQGLTDAQIDAARNQPDRESMQRELESQGLSPEQAAAAAEQMQREREQAEASAKAEKALDKLHDAARRAADELRAPPAQPPAAEPKPPAPAPTQPPAQQQQQQQQQQPQQPPQQQNPNPPSTPSPSPPRDPGSAPRDPAGQSSPNQPATAPSPSDPNQPSKPSPDGSAQPTPAPTNQPQAPQPSPTNTPAKGDQPQPAPNPAPTSPQPSITPPSGPTDPNAKQPTPTPSPSPSTEPSPAPSVQPNTPSNQPPQPSPTNAPSPGTPAPSGSPSPSQSKGDPVSSSPGSPQPSTSPTPGNTPGQPTQPAPGQGSPQPGSPPPGLQALREALNSTSGNSPNSNAPSAGRGNQDPAALRRQAQQLLEQATPSEREQMRRLAQQWAAEQQPTPGPSSPNSGLPTDRPASPGSAPATKPNTEPVDARSAPINPGQERVIAEWLSRGPREATAAKSNEVAGALRDAAQSAERALEDRTVPSRFDNVIRRYFQRLPSDLGVPATNPAPAKPATTPPATKP